MLGVMATQRRREVTPEAKARAERIARALAGMLNEEPAPPSADAPVRPGEARGLQCPRCGGAMHTVAVGKGVEIDQCGECGAIWLDAGELEALVADQAPAPDAPLPTMGALRQHMRDRVPREAAVKYRDCPRCGEAMRRTNFGTISGVVVDECVRHGVLLDTGELQAIEAFVRIGGQALGAEVRLEQGMRQVMPAPPAAPQRPAPVSPIEVAATAAGSLWDVLFRW